MIDPRPLAMSDPVRMCASLRALLKLMWRTCGGLLPPAVDAPVAVVTALDPLGVEGTFLNCRVGITGLCDVGVVGVVGAATAAGAAAAAVVPAEGVGGCICSCCCCCGGCWFVKGHFDEAASRDCGGTGVDDPSRAAVSGEFAAVAMAAAAAAASPLAVRLCERLDVAAERRVLSVA